MDAGLCGKIARRCRDDREFGLTRYPYEPRPAVGAFSGGFFEHTEWPLRKGIEKHNSLRAVSEYEAHYINSAGLAIAYWMAFHESAIELRQEAITADSEAEAQRYDVWALVAIRYGLRVVGLRAEFYKMAARDPAYAKMVIPSLQRRGDIAAADDLVEPLDNLESHMATQLMKAVATLSASNATKRANGKGGAANGQAWRELGVSDYLCRAVQFGIYEQPVTPFRQGTAAWLPEIPQTAEVRAYAEADLAEGCRSGLYEEISLGHAQRAHKAGAVISSSFTVWQEKDVVKKGRFVVNLSRQSKHWKKGSVRMENLAEFAMTLQRGDHMLSMDIYRGYRAFRIHPAMRDWFIFHYNGRFYRCVALPFGWGRSPLWFTQLMAPLVQEMRRQGWRILHYIDDFLVVPSPYGTVSSPEHCGLARPQLEALLRTFGLRRHPDKGEWEGATVVDHLGVIVDTNELKFYVRPDKARKIEASAKRIMKTAMLGKRRVPVAWLTSFCGTCVSLSLAMPWARFYTRSLYSDISITRPRDTRGRCRLSHQSLRDLKFWKTLCRQDLQGRLMQPAL